jgi:hypothetical protein
MKPFVIALVIMLLIGIGLAAYFAKHPVPFVDRRNWMHVVSVDNTGKQVGKEEIVRIPDPDSTPRYGLSHVGEQVERLFKAAGKRPTLSMFTTDGMRGFGLTRANGQTSVDITVEVAPAAAAEPQKEAAIRAYFKSRNLYPTEDYMAANGGIPNATRVLSFPLPGTSEQVTAAATKLLKDIFQIREDEAISFTLETH